MDAAAERGDSEAPGLDHPEGSGTILVVEDENAVRELSALILRDCGYTVLEARDGEEALELAAGHQDAIDLLVTDVVMPGMGGRQLVERLRESRPDLQVLFVSGYTDDEVIRHGVSRAEMEFLQKPYTPHALARKVQRMVSPRSG